MFCPKCGAQIPDGSAFCGSCGEKFNTQPQDQPKAQAPVQLKMPPLATTIKFGVAILAFIFGFLPWFKYSFDYFGVSASESFSVFTSGMFELSALLGLAKILMIISIIVFIIFIASQFIDFNKFVQLPFSVKEKAPVAYYVVYAVALIFTLIGCFTCATGGFGGVSPAACWYISLVICAAGLAITFKPALLDNILAAKK